MPVLTKLLGNLKMRMMNILREMCEEGYSYTVPLCAWRIVHLRGRQFILRRTEIFGAISGSLFRWLGPRSATTSPKCRRLPKTDCLGNAPLLLLVWGGRSMPTPGVYDGEISSSLKLYSF